MEQYKTEGVVDISANSVTATPETKHIQSLESLVKQLQENIGIQQQEIVRLRRDITRLKNDVSDIVNVLKSHG